MVKQAGKNEPLNKGRTLIFNPVLTVVWKKKKKRKQLLWAHVLSRVLVHETRDVQVVKNPESQEIYEFHFPGLESHGKLELCLLD